MEDDWKDGFGKFFLLSTHVVQLFVFVLFFWWRGDQIFLSVDIDIFKVVVLFFVCSPLLGEMLQVWLIFFKWVETTNLF